MEKIGLFMENSVNQWTDKINYFLDLYEKNSLTMSEINEFTSKLDKLDKEEFEEELKMTLGCELEELPYS